MVRLESLIKTIEEEQKSLDIGVSYYFYKKVYWKSSIIYTSYSSDEIDIWSGEEVNTHKLKAVRFGIGYIISLSDRVIFDISYNVFNEVDEYSTAKFLYSLKVIL